MSSVDPAVPRISTVPPIGTVPPASAAPPAGAVPSITTAAEPLGEDVARRTRRYLWQMGVRLVCFVLCVVIDSPVRWAFLVGAVVLPYVAVLLANAGRERTPGIDDTPTPVALPQSAARHGSPPSRLADGPTTADRADAAVPGPAAPPPAARTTGADHRHGASGERP